MCNYVSLEYKIQLLILSEIFARNCKKKKEEENIRNYSFLSLNDGEFFKNSDNEN